ncbi:thiamine phosphate synthase [Romboutsia weinsteinii]|uniref:Thiamine-phosphate synthase n=1 Tax=Romboutsia weinsteinii TaxID=2020949 RepID=A0A371J4E1_9FIRM|nr:thiamine phosphate synthase [Romboutsia weinsteinii]RDY27537.1 thiamine phosphate synthase [Romboutsia weinsteinii]
MEGNIKNDLSLYLVTDSEILANRDFYSSIEDAIKSGVTMVQLREKNASGRDFLEKALELRKITKKYGVSFIINDRVDIAMISDADGVHVGQSDIDAKSVRKLIGSDKIVGVSARTLEEAKKAKSDGADYIGIGAVFSTSTKLDAKSVNIETIEQITKEVDILSVLIGGINLSNIDKLKHLDVDGYAVVSAILKSDDISMEAKKWSDKINVMKK